MLVVLNYLIKAHPLEVAKYSNFTAEYQIKVLTDLSFFTNELETYSIHLLPYSLNKLHNLETALEHVCNLVKFGTLMSNCSHLLGRI